jgi:hypothetical protein
MFAPSATVRFIALLERTLVSRRVVLRFLARQFLQHAPDFLGQRRKVILDHLPSEF